MNAIAINPHSTISRQTISANDDCIVVDDFLQNPQDLVNFAAQRADEFSREQSSYPGPLFRVSPVAMDEIYRFIRFKMSKRFPFMKGGMDFWSYLSIATDKPNELSYLQRICHTDPERDPDRTPYAAVIYLFENEDLGGTAFYRWKAQEQVQYAESLGRDDPEKALNYLQEQFPSFQQPGKYMTDSNEIAERLCTIPARFNRLILYSGEVPHSGSITAPELLSADIHQGRLTLNIFISVIPKTGE